MRTVGRILAIACCCSALHVVARAQAPASRQAAAPTEEVQVVTVRPNFFVITGAGANIGVQIGPLGAIVVDTGSSSAAEKTLAVIKSLTTEPIRYILNTGAGRDHLGGNEVLSKAGRTLLRGGQARQMAPADILMPDAVMQHLLADHPEAVDGDHVKAFTGDQYSMYLNGEGIQIITQPAAHSGGDAIVLFRRSDVIMAGDVVDMNRFPTIDVANGGSIQGEIEALNRLLDMLIPPFPQNFQEERSILVPGHGRVADWTDLVHYRDMVTVIRDVVQDMIDRGMTLQQVQDANPAAGYRTRYGADSGPWTTKMFVEAVYTGLKNAQKTS